jgi:predicted ATP-grasp superfamily ATP-dependent carboligase
LVTNSRCAQAYAVVRALRPHAEWIVATMSGERPLGVWPTDHAAYSRLVDRRVEVPDPEQDWHQGIIQPDNTEREERFVEAVLAVCARERIDTIFPSNDPWIYVFAKNRERFTAHGILIPVPDYETVTKPLDKHRTVECAEEVGFPAPLSFLPDGERAIRRIATELPPPWVVRPRFTTGGRGLAIVETEQKLLDTAREVAARHGRPMVQEYIPGKGKQNFYLVMDRTGAPRSVFTPRVTRVAGRVFRNSTAACESAPPHPLTEQAVGLLRHVGWWGGATIQTKVDARDGQPKLMEINPRLGTHLWYRTELGINEPLLCLQIARGEPSAPRPEVPIGCLLLQPIEDAAGTVVELVDLAAFRLRTGLLRKRPMDASSPPAGLAKIAGAWRDEYFARRDRRFSPYFRYGLRDPLPSLIWTSKVLFSRALMTTKGMGR